MANTLIPEDYRIEVKLNPMTMVFIAAVALFVVFGGRRK